jgi:metal-responsive CopG/Arc/MetJ family transcriptional regulator
MKTVSLKLPAALDAKLALAAKKSRTTKSVVIRQALDSYLNGNKRLNKGSFLELAAKGVGCVEGPRDLSYNPEHMRGFGK